MKGDRKMVWRKLLAGLGFGGVEADTVLTPTPGVPGGSLTGQVNLRVKSDTDISSITLILVANGQGGEIEISRHAVAGALHLQGGTAHSVPFSIPVPAHAPFTVLYGQALPGFTTGVRTELTVSSGSAKGDFDPVRIEASAVQQSIMDALGTIGAKFAGNAVRPGATIGLPVPAAQAVTCFGPVPDGQQLGPHIPRVTFVIAPTDAGVSVVAELVGRPGTGERHDLSRADIERLSSTEEGWVNEVDGWLIAALKSATQAAPGSFLQTGPMSAAPGPQQQYAYGGRGGPGYQYDGYRRGPGVAGSMMAGVAGGALGFLGTMMIMDMLTPDMPVDAGAGDAAADPGADAGADAGAEDYAGGDYGGDYGGDFGGGDFGGGDFGGDFGGF
jgi:sporulation-control protein